MLRIGWIGVYGAGLLLAGGCMCSTPRSGSSSKTKTTTTTTTSGGSNDGGCGASDRPTRTASKPSSGGCGGGFGGLSRWDLDDEERWWDDTTGVDGEWWQDDPDGDGDTTTDTDGWGGGWDTTDGGDTTGSDGWGDDVWDDDAWSQGGGATPPPQWAMPRGDAGRRGRADDYGPLVADVIDVIELPSRAQGCAGRGPVIDADGRVILAGPGLVAYAAGG